LTHDWNTCALTAIKDFIARANAHKVFTVVMQTPQVTQAMSFFEVKFKTILDIGCDHLAPRMAIIFSVHALHLQMPYYSRKHRWWRLEKDISIESNQQELNFLKRYLIII
jgi:hypothetical protein